jgi:hypothetical protein
MSDTVETLILDLLDWLMIRDRTYEEVMGAWRTSCPRLPVWEDANNRGLIAQEEINGRCIVRVTSSGRAFLGQRRVQNT